MTAEREAELVERLADCGLAAEAADLAPGASTAAAKVRSTASAAVRRCDA